MVALGCVGFFCFGFCARYAFYATAVLRTAGAAAVFAALAQFKVR